MAMLADAAGRVWRLWAVVAPRACAGRIAGSAGMGLAIVVTSRQDYMYAMFSRFKKPAIFLVSAGVLAAPLAPDPVAVGTMSSPVFVADDAPPDFDPGEAGARMAQIAFGSTTVNSTQPEVENTYIGPAFNVTLPDPAYKVAALVRGRATPAADGVEGGLLKDTDPQSPMRWSHIIITDPSSGSVPSS